MVCSYVCKKYHGHDDDYDDHVKDDDDRDHDGDDDDDNEVDGGKRKYIQDLVDDVSASDMIPGSSSNMLKMKIGKLKEKVFETIFTWMNWCGPSVHRVPARNCPSRPEIQS